MKKNNTVIVIVATALIAISTSMQGMEHAKEIILTKNDTSYVIPTNQDILQALITTSPESKDPKSITTHYYDPSIMTALYIRYKNGAQFAGTTCCPLSNFLSDFYEESTALKKLCSATTQGNNLAHIERINFWYLKPQNLSAEDLNLYDKRKTAISKMLRDHFSNAFKFLFRNKDVSETELWIDSTLTENTADYVFADTHRNAQLKVTLYPKKGTLELNGNVTRL